MMWVLGKSTETTTLFVKLERYLVADRDALVSLSTADG